MLLKKMTSVNQSMILRIIHFWHFLSTYFNNDWYMFFSFSGGLHQVETKLCSSWAANVALRFAWACFAGDSWISRANPVNQNVDLGYQDIYIYTLYTIYMCKKKQDMILGMSQGLRWFQPFNLEKKKQLYKCKVSRRNASSKHMVSTDLFFLEGSLPPCLFISWKFQPGKYVHRADEWRCCCILQLLEVSRLPFPNRHEFLAVLNCLVFPQKGCLLYTPQWTEQIFVEGFLRCGLKKRPMRQN